MLGMRGGEAPPGEGAGRTLNRAGRRSDAPWLSRLTPEKERRPLMGSVSRLRPKVYTVSEFARVFATSPRLVRDLIRKGEIPALRLGHSYRIPRKAAEEYLARALPPPSRSFSKPRIREIDELTGFLFPVGTMH